MKPILLACLLACACNAAPAGDVDMAKVVYAAPYTIQALDKARISSQGGAPNFQRLRADIDLHDGPFASVKLVADLATTCFPFERWADDPPPMGQRWPPSCDAFDRNYEFTLDEPATPEGRPALELSRAITPFGGPMHLEIDLTDVANGLPGRHSLHVTIPTYSDGAGMVSGSNGGWTVSARIEATPGPAPRNVLAVVPLLNLSHGAGTMAKDYPFTVPAGTTSGRLEYRVTGHGGGARDAACIGPAEEFCRREHSLSIDGELVEAIKPWRSDCTKNCTLTHYDNGMGGFDYCLENPCGAVASVRAPRANWCPGTPTPPFTWEEAPALSAPGAHTLSYTIDKVAAGGSWRMSAVYFAFGK